jgi:hypothetical protein
MHLGKEEAKSEILNKGILGILGSTQSAQFTSIFGRGSAVGDAQEDVMGNLIAANIDNGYGTGGFGILGTGHGGAGTGWGTIGTGNFNTLGGRGYGHSPGSGELRRHIARTPTVTPGMVTLSGSFS